MGDFDPSVNEGIFNVSKFDLNTNRIITKPFGKDMVGGESTFFSRGQGEDNGYLGTVASAK